MTILINVALFLIIFGYTIYILIKTVRKAKEGQCGSCSSKCHCEDQIKNTENAVVKQNSFKN